MSPVYEHRVPGSDLLTVPHLHPVLVPEVLDARTVLRVDGLDLPKRLARGALPVDRFAHEIFQRHLRPAKIAVSNPPTVALAA